MSDNFRLCIISPSFKGGGAEKIAVSLANYYSSKGLDVSLMVFCDEGPYKTMVRDGVRVINLNVNNGLLVFFAMFNALLKERPSHVLSVIRYSNIMVGVFAWLVRGPKIAFREANTMNTVLGLPVIKRMILKSLMTLGYKKADLVIANSSDTKMDLVSNGIIEADKVVVSVNPVLPVDFKVLESSEIDHPWLTNPNFKVILNVGRLHVQKNQSLLIQAFSLVHRLHPDSRLIIIGEGEEEHNLLDLIDKLELGEYVQIIGFQKNPYPYYRLADVFVLSSSWEGFGNVIVEAMAAGTPVISTNCPGGPREILSMDKYGTLVPVRSVSDMADAIKDVMLGGRTDPEILKRRAMDYSVNKVGDRYLRLIKGL